MDLIIENVQYDIAAPADIIGVSNSLNWQIGFNQKTGIGMGRKICQVQLQKEIILQV